MEQKKYICTFRDESGYCMNRVFYASNITQALNKAKKQIKIDFGYVDIAGIEEV